MQHDAGSLAAIEIVKSFGAEVILDRLSLNVNAGDRVGVVGPNGSGKTTLLRVLAGTDAPDLGRVARRPASLEVRYVPQEPDAQPGERLLDFLARKTGVGPVEAEMDALAARLASEPALAERYSDALERFLALGGDDFTTRARQVAAAVGLGAERLEQPLESMSGGEAARASLAVILLSRVDVLLLDEPTNDLDFAGLELLERFVDETRAALVVVSHDRAFLERAVTRVVEFEAETRRIREFAGSWAEYERQRAAARQRHEEAYGTYVDERERFERLLGTRRTEARAGGAMADRRGTHALSTKVRAAEKRLEQLDVVDKPWRPWRLQLSFGAPRRAGDVAARLDRAVVAHGGFRLGPVTLELRAGDRIALVGPNGSGKTTLLRALLGEVQLEAGARSAGPGTKFGRLEQARATFSGHRQLLRAFTDASSLRTEEARTLLAKFALGADDVGRPADSLSPGERTRATLALLAAQGANTLVLDEPTNHLDLEAIEELEAALDAFAGTVVLVTHDRRLLRRFRATRVVEVTAGRVRER
jgi:ATPase subunit of ABC transporter with duplicated ATPase domains